MAIFDLDRIRQATFISHLDFHEELGSTNTRALHLATELKAFPALVLAERQTAGRGRGDHRWWAGPGALTLSLLFRPADYAIPTARVPMISLAAGLAVTQTVSETVSISEVRMKWPNDVLINGRKVCGILVESASSSPGVIVLGVGLNVNNSTAEAPQELQAIATSLYDIAAKQFDQTMILVALLQRIEMCLELLNQDPAELVHQWRSCCYLQGRTVQLQPGLPGSIGERVTGVCQGVDDDGALLLQTESGIVRCVSGAVVKIL